MYTVYKIPSISPVSDRCLMHTLVWGNKAPTKKSLKKKLKGFLYERQREGNPKNHGLITR